MLVVSLGLDYLIPETTSRPAGLGHVLLQVLDVLEGVTNSQQHSWQPALSVASSTAQPARAGQHSVQVDSLPHQAILHSQLQGILRVRMVR